MEIKDFYIADIVGGAKFDIDFLFNDSIKEHAAKIQSILFEKNLKNLRVEIEDKNLYIKESSEDEQDGRTVFRINESYITFSTARIKVIDLIEKKEDKLYKIHLFDELVKVFKPNQYKDVIGLKPSFIIPFKEKGINMELLFNCLNKSQFPNHKYFDIPNSRKFELSIVTMLNENMFLEFNLSRTSKHLELDCDFKFQERNSYTFYDFLSEYLSKEYFDWLENFSNNLTNSFEKVNIQYLTKGFLEE